MLAPWRIILLSLRQVEIHLPQKRNDPLNNMVTNGTDYPEVFNLCSAQSMWFAAEKREMERPLTTAESETLVTGVPMSTIAEARLWNKRPDGIAIKMPKEGKQGEFITLEFQRMSDVTANYLSRATDKAEGQYVSPKSALALKGR